MEYSTEGEDIVTTYCKLISADGSIAIGTGKGLSDQSQASAVFEAIEHLASGSQPPGLKCVDLDLQGDDAYLVGGSPGFAGLPSGLSLSLSRVNAYALGGEPKAIQYPYFLRDPGFCSRDTVEANCLRGLGLARYATNSGVAAGLSATDAILHGLLELIERDAIGVTLLATIFSSTPRPVRRLSRERLGDLLGEDLNRIETAAGRRLDAWDITTDLQVPVLLARLKGQDGRAFYGSGASLSFAYALLRAGTEALQFVHGVRSGRVVAPAVERERHLLPMSASQLLNGQFGFRGGEEVGPWGADASRHLDLSSAEQVDEIVSMLIVRGIHVYHCPLLSGAVHVEHVISPQLERFFLVSYGVPVAPGSRGKAFLSGRNSPDSSPLC